MAHTETIPSVNVGNAGEHLVMAELLARGYQAFRADRCNPAFDIAVDVHGQTSMIRVKTTRCSDVQWSAKSGGTIFLDLREVRDFVAIVDLRSSQGIRGAVIYLVPTAIVDTELRRVIDVYKAHPKRDGGQRKVNGQRILRLDGEDRPDNPSFGYATKWAQYREAWKLLEQ